MSNYLQVTELFFNDSFVSDYWGTGKYDHSKHFSGLRTPVLPDSLLFNAPGLKKFLQKLKLVTTFVKVFKNDEIYFTNSNKIEIRLDRYLILAYFSDFFEPFLTSEELEKHRKSVNLVRAYVGEENYQLIRKHSMLANCLAAFAPIFSRRPGKIQNTLSLSVSDKPVRFGGYFVDYLKSGKVNFGEILNRTIAIETLLNSLRSPSSNCRRLCFWLDETKDVHPLLTRTNRVETLLRILPPHTSRQTSEFYLQYCKQLFSTLHTPLYMAISDNYSACISYGVIGFVRLWENRDSDNRYQCIMYTKPALVLPPVSSSNLAPLEGVKVFGRNIKSPSSLQLNNFEKLASKLDIVRYLLTGKSCPDRIDCNSNNWFLVAGSIVAGLASGGAFTCYMEQ